MPLNIQFLSFT